MVIFGWIYNLKKLFTATLARCQMLGLPELRQKSNSKNVQAKQVRFCQIWGISCKKI